MAKGTSARKENKKDAKKTPAEKRAERKTTDSQRSERRRFPYKFCTFSVSFNFCLYDEYVVLQKKNKEERLKETDHLLCGDIADIWLYMCVCVCVCVWWIQILGISNCLFMCRRNTHYQYVSVNDRI